MCLPAMCLHQGLKLTGQQWKIGGQQVFQFHESQFAESVTQKTDNKVAKFMSIKKLKTRKK